VPAELLTSAADQGAEDERGGAGVVERGVRGSDVETKQLDQLRQPRRLAFREVQDAPGERRGVDDGVFERALEPAADEPCVECVVAVLDQHGALGKTQKRPTRIAELRRPDEHRAVYVMPFLGVRVDRCPAVDERVEEGERP
jgi:hypothetical protein